MSYPPEKSIPLAISTLDECVKMVKRKSKEVDDTSLETIFLNYYKQNDDKEFIDELFFKLHAASNQAMRIIAENRVSEIEEQRYMEKELRYKDAAKELGCSVSQIKKLVKEDKLKVKHYSLRDVRITMSEICRYRNSIT